MPVTVAISTTRRVLWWHRRATFRCLLPESWSDVPAASRLKWLAWWVQSPATALERITLDATHLPMWAWRAMSASNKQAIVSKFSFTEPKPDCEQIPVAEFEWKGQTYGFPSAKGANITCLEYAVAEDYYKALEGGDEQSLWLLAATLWRECDADRRSTLQRGDPRVPLYDKAEVEARAVDFQGAPMEILLQALLYFVGLKMYVHRVYRTWLFDAPEDDDDEEEDASPEPPTRQSGGPDFGWWGVFQYVAEVGLFGKVKEVYQTSFHEVCVFLVRKRMEAEKMQRSLPTPKPQED